MTHFYGPMGKHYLVLNNITVMTTVKTARTLPPLLSISDCTRWGICGRVLTVVSMTERCFWHFSAFSQAQQYHIQNGQCISTLILKKYIVLHIFFFLWISRERDDIENKDQITLSGDLARFHWVETSFLSFSSIDIFLCWGILCCRDCLMHCRLFSSTVGGSTDQKSVPIPRDL